MILAAVIAIFGVTGAAAVSPERPPATMSVDANSAPFWISAAAATAPDGTVRYDVFPPGIREVVKASGAPASARLCGQLAIANTDEPFVGNAKRSEGILNGTVTAITDGFLGSVPASMLTVHVDEVLRDAGGVSALPDVFVPYYAADFTIGGTRFCNAGLPPQVGDRVVVRFSAPLIGKYINAQELRATAAGRR